MTFRDIAGSALNNLRRRKVRTLLTTAGVWIGILTVVTMLSLGIGLQDQVTDTIAGWGLQTVVITPAQQKAEGAIVNPYALPRPDHPILDADLATFRALPGVEAVTPYLNLPDGLIIHLVVDGKSYPLTLDNPVSRQTLLAPKVEISAGQDLQPGADSRGLLLSQAYLREQAPAGLGAAPIGRRVTLHVESARGDSADFPVTVVGANTAPGGGQIGTADVLDIEKWWYNAPDVLQTQGYSPVVIRTASLGAAAAVAQRATDLGFQPLTLQVLLDQVNRLFVIVQVLLSSIGLLALLVAALGIANTMMMAIFERTREIGVLKALGASNGDVLRLFVVEAGGIGLLGGVAGVLGGWALSRLLDALAHQYLADQQVTVPGPLFVLTPGLVAGALVFATLIGLLAGLGPAARAARLDPVAALRQE